MPKRRDVDELRRRLQEAAATQALVRVSRGIRRVEKLEGFIVGVGQAWVLLARLDGSFIELDGYVAVRLADITKVTGRGGPDTFVGRALAARGQWPPRSADVNLDDTAQLVRTGAQCSPFVSLYIEREAPDMCFIGTPVRFTKRKVDLLEVTPEAQWRDDGPSRWRLHEVTRVEFANHYIDALALIAPPAPE